MAVNLQPMNELEALRLVVAGTNSETGIAFFRSLVRNLSLALGTQGAWVTEYLPRERRLRAMAMWMAGEFVDHYEYPISGTACERVVESKDLIHIPERVIELFPQDTDLVPLNAVSYLGAPLLDSDGSVLGHVSVLDDKPMPRDERALSIFRVFAVRAVAELRRLRTEELLRASEEELSLFLENTMDAIVIVNGDGRFCKVNPAAERLFGCTEEDLIDERLADFLAPESEALLARFTRELAGRPAGHQQIWVPEEFVVRRWDHSVFPAEGTISRFVRGDAVYHALILRNAAERIEAVRQVALLAQETDYLREAMRQAPAAGDLIGRSDCMQRVRDAIRQVAPTDTTVLITGETGTGKELVARAIHRASSRASRPLVVVNCAAIPANLIESELFGHERGAFTGATARREGRFLLADRGTLFLDEIGELPIELQSKLLRVLQEGEFAPVGSSRTQKVDVRVVAATHRDLESMVQEGGFREDLFFRLNVFPIRIPPLRERNRDIDLLAEEFARGFAHRMGRIARPLRPEDTRMLRDYHWPGNVRELQNVVERAIILSNTDSLEIERAMVGFTRPDPEPPTAASIDDQRQHVLKASELEALERANMILALERCGGKISGQNGAARLIGIPPTTFTSRMKALRIKK